MRKRLIVALAATAAVLLIATGAVAAGPTGFYTGTSGPLGLGLWLHYGKLTKLEFADPLAKSWIATPAQDAKYCVQPQYASTSDRFWTEWPFTFTGQTQSNGSFRFIVKGNDSFVAHIAGSFLSNGRARVTADIYAPVFVRGPVGLVKCDTGKQTMTMKRIG